MTIAGSRAWLRAFFAGLAQLIFCSTPPAGVLVALGLGVLSPWMLAGAAGGCLLGTLAGRVMPRITREAWLVGLAGFNPAILGIVGAGALAAGQQDAVWLPVLVLACTGLACAISGPFSRFGLYPFSAPAYLIALLTSLALAPAGAWWWPAVDTATFSPLVPWIATACMIAAMTSEAPEAAGWAALAAVLAYLTAVDLMGIQASDAAGLWGVVAPLSAFAVLRLFGRHGAARLALGAAGMATAIWLWWQSSLLAVVAPPLVAPMILALWLVMILRRRPPPAVMQGAFWACLGALVRARWHGRPVAVVTGSSLQENARQEANGGSAGPGDRAAIGADSDRWNLWSKADRLRHFEADAAATPTAAALRKAVGSGVVDLVIAGDVIGRFDAIDEGKRIDAAGRADRLSCLACAKPAPWPPADLWRRMTLHCPCGGILLPDLREAAPARSGALEADVMARLGSEPGVLLVLEELGCGAALGRRLETSLRVAGGAVFRITPATARAGDGKGPERAIVATAARTLGALAVLAWLLPRRRRRGASPGRAQAEAEAMP